MESGGLLNYRPDVYDYEYDPVEFTVTDTGGGVTIGTQVLAGIKDRGLDHVLYASINQDKGVAAGTSTAKVQVKFLPSQQVGKGGGDMYHTYACRSSFNQNDLPLGVKIRPGEDVTIKVVPNVASASVRVRVERYRAFLKGQSPR